MRNGKSIHRPASRGLFFTCCAIGWAVCGAVLTADAQTSHATAAPDLDNVVTLSRAGMSPDVIETFIANSGNSYSLSEADVDYLHKHGVSDAVIDFLLKTDESVGSARSISENTGDNPPTVNGSATNSSRPRPSGAAAAKLDNFKTQLAPYGNWADVPGYGMAWHPSSMEPNWRPYFDGGSWTYSDEGWYWRTGYAWGDIVFHYGRWVLTPRGWFWVPGYEYAPSWVVWRNADRDGYIGWAPLPPGAVLVNGGWVYRGVRVARDFDFGLGARDFTFVPHAGFWDHDFRRLLVADALVADIFHRSRFENHFWFDHDHFLNYGIDSAIVATLTHHDIHETKVQELRQEEETRNMDARRRDLQAMRESGQRPNSMAVMTAAEDLKAPGRGGRRGRGARANNATTAEATPLNTRQGGAESTAETGTRGGRRGRGERANEAATKETPAQNTRRGGAEAYKPETGAREGRSGRGETPKTPAAVKVEPEKKPVRGPREEPAREERPRKENNDRGGAAGN